MPNSDTHVITFGGSMQDIERFAKDYQIVVGDRAAGEEPDMKLVAGCRGTEFDICDVGPCHVEINLEAIGGFVDPVGVYRGWMNAYPTLRIDWRYASNIGFNAGYIDETGDHRWHEVENDSCDETAVPHH